jgi:MFS family permease
MFRSLWIASMVSNFGGLVQGVGAAWLMTSLSESADMVALVQASTTLPIMAFSLMSGAVADGYDRRRVMLAAQAFMFVVSVALTVCAFAGVMTPWLLLSFTFLIGCGMAFHNPAWQASVGDIVPREQIPSAVLLNGMGFNVMRSVGPAVGGIIVATAGAAAAFVVNAVSYVGLISVIGRWSYRKPPSTLPREPLASAMTAGVRYVGQSPHILRVLLRGFAFGVTTIVILALLPLVARNQIQGTALVFGVLLGAFGVGAVGGAFASPRLRAIMTNEMLVRWAFLGFALCAAVTALSTWAWLTALALVVGGAAWVMALSLFNTSVQIASPRWVVGRAMSLYQMSIFGGMALGSWLWGTVAEQTSLTTAMLAAAVSMVVGAAIGLRVPLPGRRTMNLDPVNRWQEPSTALRIRPSSGPVAVFVEYDIDPAHVGKFMRLMQQRRRIRRRDGAVSWTLFRDVERPTVWIEQFEIPTWVDYVRFHQRTTHEDAGIGDLVRALHRGEGPPRVRRLLIRDPAHSPVDPLIQEPPDLHA